MIQPIGGRFHYSSQIMSLAMHMPLDHILIALSSELQNETDVIEIGIGIERLS